MNWDEVSRLHEWINNHPDGIILAGSQRKTHDEIHTDVFPLPGRSIQQLQQTGRSEMICLDPSTSISFCNIASSLTHHSHPPELRSQIMVHLGAAKVNRVLGRVSFIKYLLLQSLATRNDYLVIEQQRPFVIDMKAVNLGITLSQPSLYVGHNNILLLTAMISPLKDGVRVTMKRDKSGGT
jgi:hypothetical protein